MKNMTYRTGEDKLELTEIKFQGCFSNLENVFFFFAQCYNNYFNSLVVNFKCFFL